MRSWRFNLNSAAGGVNPHRFVRNRVQWSEYGRGLAGNNAQVEFSHDLENVYLTIACSEFQEAELIEAIRPSLKKLGGMCLVSDAMWVIHEA